MLFNTIVILWTNILTTTREGAIAAAIGKVVDAGQLAGAATLVWRDGRSIETACVGWRDVEAGLPIERDTLFRIASMTKPITSAAALMLLEEGRFALDDPIARWAPEFAEMRVLRSPRGPLDDTVAAARPITFEDLLTHRSGITYGAFWPGPLAHAYEEALGGEIDSEVAPDEWIARLAALPLIDQPGAALHYGHSTDLLGVLIARIEDAPLGEVLERRIFSPLGMKDTGFTVPPEKHARRAALYGFDEAGRLTKRSAGPGHSFRAERPADMTFVGGGAGLWSTLDDYLAFARMFVGERRRGWRAATAARDARADDDEPADRGAARDVGSGGLAAVRRGSRVRHGRRGRHGTRAGRAHALRRRRGRGRVAGRLRRLVAGRSQRRSVLIFLSHNMVEADQFARGIGFGVYRAIREFHTLASTTRPPLSIDGKLRSALTLHEPCS